MEQATIAGAFAINFTATAGSIMAIIGMLCFLAAVLGHWRAPKPA